MTVREEESTVAQAEGKAAFERVLLKLSGEALMGDKEFGLELPRIEAIAEEIVDCQKTGVEIAIVVGAGNIYRGMAAAAEGMDRAAERGWTSISEQWINPEKLGWLTDFAALAKSFGIYGEGPILDPEEIRAALERGLNVVKERRTPVLIDTVTQSRCAPQEDTSWRGSSTSR